VVLDKDSKFFGVCREALNLLQINCHVLSGDNHNPMIVERVNRYLTKGLKIMTNERDSVHFALEAILLLLYAWNSSPIPGTDISRSLIAVGREFAFPIDYSTNKHWELTSSPTSVESYSRHLATRLSAIREVAHLLVKEHIAYHRELINSRRPDPRTYSVGDIVFARRATRSDAVKGPVDKFTYAFTGPWPITALLKGASYKLEHCYTPNRKEKKHASDLSRYSWSSSRFSHWTVPTLGRDSYTKQLRLIHSARLVLMVLTRLNPSKYLPTFFTTDQLSQFHWPSLSELNEELSPFPWSSEEEWRHYFSGDTILTLPVMYTGPPPSAPMYSTPTIPPLSILSQSIIQSSAKLFFISHSIDTNDAREWRLV